MEILFGIMMIVAAIGVTFYIVNPALIKKLFFIKWMYLWIAKRKW